VTSLITKLLGQIKKAEESKLEAYYEVRWWVYSGSSGTGTGKPMVEKFTTREAADEYAKALVAAAHFTGQGLWDSPRIVNLTPEPRGENAFKCQDEK